MPRLPLPIAASTSTAHSGKEPQALEPYAPFPTAPTLGHAHPSCHCPLPPTFPPPAHKHEHSWLRRVFVWHALWCGKGHRGCIRTAAHTACSGSREQTTGFVHAYERPWAWRKSPRSAHDQEGMWTRTQGVRMWMNRWGYNERCHVWMRRPKLFI